MSLVVKVDGDPRAFIGPVRGIVKAVDPRLAVSEVRTMQDIVNAAIGGQRFAMETLGTFGAVALLLSAIGIFGIVAQVVASRFQEFGIRAALGATPADLTAIGLRSGLRQAMVGLVVGMAVALMLTRVLGALLQGVTPNDPLTFAAVIVVTGVVAVLASLAPAYRAGRIPPNSALRAE
jgi:putative ABC transport system permease protein